MDYDALFDARTLIAIIVVVGAVTGGNLWMNRNNPPLGFNRYEGYGFSIDYRNYMSFEITGVGAGSATESIGSVEGALERESVEQFGVIWVTQQSLPSHLENTPEGALDYVFDMVGTSGTQISDRGEMQTGSKDGHDMAYQTFDVDSGPPVRGMQTGSKDGHDMAYQTFDVDSGPPVRGIVGAWYCDEVGKYLMLYVIHVPDVAQPLVLSQDVEGIWLGYLDSLVCH
jgi:hypothetical protein